MNVKQKIHQILRKIGYDIVRYDARHHPLARRKHLMESYRINLVLDVGANVGDYGKQLRSIGYKGKIISFEPLSSAYKELIIKANSDASWEAMNYALGNTNCITEINIAGNLDSSSILEMLPSHLKSAPQSEYVGKEKIRVRTLDSVFETMCSQDQNIYLKMDTQGYEKHIVEGAEQALKYIDTIQLEMSLIPLYKNQSLFYEMYQLLSQKGYSLVSIEQGFSDKKTGQLLQIDGIFHRF